MGVVTFGVSVDDAERNAAFRKEHELPFALFCDTDRKLAIAYGAASDENARFARRIAVLIDEEGVIAERWDRVDPRAFAATVLRSLTPQK